MSGVETFSTQGVPQADRLSLWTSGSRTIGGIEVDILSTRPFQGGVSRRSLGSAKVYGMSTAPHRASWTQRLIRQSEEELPFRVYFQQRGTTVLVTDGVEHVVRPGEWFVSDGRRPYVSLHPTVSRKITLQMPADRLPAAERDAVRKLMRGVPVRGGVAQMLRHCLETSILDGEPTSEALDADLGETMMDFVRLMIREHMAGTTAPSMQELTRERIRAFVRRNLGNPLLSVDMIAAAMKCSKRYVHKVFNDDLTVSEYIWSQRLEQCRAALERPDAQGMTLTQIAFDHGFSSSAHFSRAFRDRYGIPPRAFRRDLMPDGARGAK